MASVRFTDMQVRPTKFLACTSLTLDEFPQLAPPFPGPASPPRAVRQKYGLLVVPNLPAFLDTKRAYGYSSSGPQTQVIGTRREASFTILRPYRYRRIDSAPNAPGERA